MKQSIFKLFSLALIFALAMGRPASAENCLRRQPNRVIHQRIY